MLNKRKVKLLLFISPINIFFLLLMCFINADLLAQENKDLYEDYKEKLFEDYDYNEYLKKQRSEFTDSLTAEDQVLISPELLRKLGVSRDVINKILQLNEQKDSIFSIRKDFEAYTKKEAGIGDSIGLEDIEALIEYQKRLVVRKALSLPESYIYGHEFFRKSGLKLFDKEVEMKPAENYILGVGDEINISIWGQSDYNQTLKVGKLGAIKPEYVGKIYLRGLTFASAKSIIKEKYSTVYDLKKSNIEITLNYTRIVNVNFVGELFNPGTYRFPALNTVFNALVAIEGPNQIGSVRSIQIRRNGKIIRYLDLYEFLTNPNSSSDYFLEDNDYVVVPPLKNVVAITGQIRRENSYELKDGEGIKELINYAGGLSSFAYRKSITIKRVQNSKEVLLNVNLDSLDNYRRNFQLLNGDSIFIYRIPTTLRNYVQVTGAVNVPGKYELRKGDKISDILLKAEGLSDEAFANRAYVQRLDKNLNKQLKIFNPSEVLVNPYSSLNILLNDLDTIQIISKKSFKDEFVVNISGAVKTPGVFEYAEGMTLKDVLFYAGGLKKEAANNRIEISRIQNFSNETFDKNKNRIIIDKVKIGKDLEIEDGSEKYLLNPFDHIFVRVSPDFELQQNVKIFGEVLFPGEYTLLNKEENIISLIERAGGLTDYAFEQGATLYRKQDSTGFVILNLENVNKENKSKFNYILTDADSIYIPKVKDFVTLRGAVNYPKIDSIGQINVPYEGNKTAKYYINKYGAGFSDDAKRRRTYVTLANGGVLQTTNLFVSKIYPKVEKGSVIFVDIKDKKKPENVKEEEDKKDWNKNFETLTSGLLTVFTLLILAQQAIN